MRLRKKEETSFGEVPPASKKKKKKRLKIMLEPNSGRNLKDEEWCEVYTEGLKLCQPREGDMPGGLEVSPSYFSTCVLLTWMCLVCENTPNHVLTVYELFNVYIILKLKGRNISVTRTQIKKAHQAFGIIKTLHSSKNTHRGRGK